MFISLILSLGFGMLASYFLISAIIGHLYLPYAKTNIGRENMVLWGDKSVNAKHLVGVRARFVSISILFLSTFWFVISLLAEVVSLTALNLVLLVIGMFGGFLIYHYQKTLYFKQEEENPIRLRRDY